MTLKTFTFKTAVAAVLATLSLAAAAQQFTIKDIRIEGIARTEPGTVFSHLPFRVGDEYTPEKGALAIRALYQSGLFRDVNLTENGDVVVVHLIARPAVATIETNGIKAFDKQEVEKSLRAAGLAEGRIFNSATLDKATQELRRQYLAKGHYGVEVTTNVSPLERNRVRVTINVDEGAASSIKEIHFTGLKAAKASELRDVMQLSTPGWFTWYTKRDQYSREKLAGDLESIRSWYLNRGYLDYRLDSVQVTIAPNKEDVFISINIHEGLPYKVKAVKVEGEQLGLNDQLAELTKPVKIGETYNAESVNQVSSAIKDKLSVLGYAFATANPNPVTNSADHTVDVVYTVDPGRRAYVRNVFVTGNTRTRDEVVRREVRQYEASWFDSDKVKLSRDRIDRLGFFDEVTAEPVPVPGTRDEVDLKVHVKERPTGSISLGAGFSSSDGIILSAGISQNNIFGTGNSASIEASNSDSTRTYALSLTQPYVTPEGVSRTIDVYDRRVLRYPGD